MKSCLILIACASLALAACDNGATAPVDQNRATWNDVSPADQNAAADSDTRELPPPDNAQ